MSFDLICENCGAISGPSVGVCPYCKTSFAQGAKEGAAHSEASSVMAAYEKGNLDEAFSLAQAAEQQNPKITEDPHFALLYARILIEVEAPKPRIKAILNKVILQDPRNESANELMQLVLAMSLFTKEQNDPGEQQMRAILKKNPNLDLALFLLGAHLFWVSGEMQESIRFLEQCVKMRPNFLRAWACLGSIYQKLGNKTLAARSFERCVDLEKEPQMKLFFMKQLQG